jgi:hypothetical protein
VYTRTIGGSTVYTIRYTNTVNVLNLAATKVVLTDTFSPAPYLIANAPGWNLVSTGVYTRLLPNLPAGASGSVTFALQIDPSIPESYLAISNSVRIGALPPADVPEAIEQPASNNIAVDIDTIRGADIAVVGLTYRPLIPQQGRPITVVVTLQNLGVDPTLGPKIPGVSDPGGWFGADLYVKPVGAPPPSGPADRYLGLCPTPTNPCPTTDRWDLYKIIKAAPGVGLATGETWQITYTYKLPSGGRQWLYVQADPYWAEPDPVYAPVYGLPQTGRITESNELNNIYGPVLIDVRPNIYLPLIRKNSP